MLLSEARMDWTVLPLLCMGTILQCQCHHCPWCTQTPGPWFLLHSRGCRTWWNSLPGSVHWGTPADQSYGSADLPAIQSTSHTRKTLTSQLLLLQHSHHWTHGNSISLKTANISSTRSYHSSVTEWRTMVERIRILDVSLRTRPTQSSIPNSLMPTVATWIQP